MNKYILLLLATTSLTLNAASKGGAGDELPSTASGPVRVLPYQVSLEPMPIDPMPVSVPTPSISLTGEKAIMTYMVEMSLYKDNPVKYAMRSKLLAEYEFIQKLRNNHEEVFLTEIYPEGIDKAMKSLLVRIRELFNTSSRV